VGKTTLLGSLDCLRPRGMAVSFGQSSGPAAALEPLLLGQKGSLFLTRPALPAHIAERWELEWRAREVFQWIGEGKLKLRVEKTYPLADAAQAHRDLEGRGTTGKLMLAI
jgi:NADPH2:quinone reductase